MTAKIVKTERKTKSIFFIPRRSLSCLQHRIEEDVACIDLFAGDHAEDGDVLRTVRQRQFYLHALIVGVGEDAVLRYVLYRRPLLQRCMFSVYRQYHKE